MSQFPPGDFGTIPQRTSLLAITALVLSLICPIPGLGVLGMILGLCAIIAIGRSEGRLGGTGMAVAGIILGLFVTAGWVIAGVAVVSVVRVFESGFSGPVASVAQAIEAGDAKGSRALFVKEVNDAVTDAEIAAFREAYHAELGAFKNMPTGIVDVISAYASAGPAMQTTSNLIPLVAEFEQGRAIYVVQVPSSFNPQPSPQGGPKLIVATNLGIFTFDGKQIWLRDTSAPTPPAPAPAPDPAGPGGGPGGG